MWNCFFFFIFYSLRSYFLLRLVLTYIHTKAKFSQIHLKEQSNMSTICLNVPGDWSIQNWNIKGKSSILSNWSSVNALFHNSLNFLLSIFLLKIIRILITFMWGLHRHSHLYKMTAVFSFLWQSNFMESSKRNHISYWRCFIVPFSQAFCVMSLSL